MDIIIRMLYGLLWIGIAIVFSFVISFIIVNGNNFIMKHFKNGKRIILSIYGGVILIASYFIEYSLMFSN